MSADPNQVRQAIQNAREALRRGEQTAARHWAEQAARLAPQTEEPWLLMAAVSEPRASVEYAKRALVINPQSQRARKAVDWAANRLGPQEAARPVDTSYSQSNPPRVAADSPLQNLPKANRTVASREEESPSPKKTARRSLAFPILLIGFACIVVAVTGWWASPVVASILSTSNQPLPTPTQDGPHFVQADINKPTFTPEWTSTPEWTFTPSLTPTDLPTLTPTVTLTPEFTFTPLPTDTPLPTETPGEMEMAIVPDTPTSVAPPTKAYVAPAQPAYVAPSGASGGTSYGSRWIDVNLSQQMVYAYEGDVVVNSFLASTGTWQHPTVTGSYKIYVKYLSVTMTGPGYNLPNVPYTMYFYKGYGIHGTYWHHNFGVPMSHGCVNLSIPDAEWLYNWASVGTVVNVHY
jgi:lipoprotein-anchoring transpeptidase ErfK/SrfK